VESATFAPQASMFGKFLNEDIAEMAAAYLFGFVASQGFVDGNKRTGAACAVTFLGHNGYLLTCTDDELYDTTMAVANRQMGKQDLADWIAEHLAPLE
jgi:death on curing protein